MVIVIATVFSLNIYLGTIGNVTADINGGQETDDVGTVPSVLPETESGQENTQPVFANGMDAVMYALDKLKTGMDFKCLYTNTVVSGGTGQVDLITTKYRHKNHDILSCYSTSSIAILDIGKFYEATYSNGTQKMTRTTSNYNYQNKTHQFTNESIDGEIASGFEYSDARCEDNNFQIAFTSEMGRVGYFDKSNKNTYEVKIILNQKYLNDLQYTKNMLGHGVNDVDMQKINITFTIDKKTGYLLKAVTDEVYSVKVPVLGYLACTSQSKAIYTYTESVKDEVISFVQTEFGINLEG